MIPPIAAESRDKRTAVSMLRTDGGSDLLAKSYLIRCIRRAQRYHPEGVKYVRDVEWAVIGGEWLPNSFRPWHAEISADARSLGRWRGEVVLPGTTLRYEAQVTKVLSTKVLDETHQQQKRNWLRSTCYNMNEAACL